MSVLTIGEFRKGVIAKKREDADAAARLSSWIDGLELSFADRIVGIDVAIAKLWGEWSGERPRSVVDTLLAATAVVHEFTSGHAQHSRYRGFAGENAQSMGRVGRLIPRSQNRDLGHPADGTCYLVGSAVIDESAVIRQLDNNRTHTNGKHGTTDSSPIVLGNAKDSRPRRDDPARKCDRGHVLCDQGSACLANFTGGSRRIGFHHGRAVRLGNQCVPHLDYLRGAEHVVGGCRLLYVPGMQAYACAEYGC